MQNKSATHHLKWWQTLPWLFASGISGLASKLGDLKAHRKSRDRFHPLVCLHHFPIARSIFTKKIEEEDTVAHGFWRSPALHTFLPGAFLPPSTFSANPAGFPSLQLCWQCAPGWGGKRSPMVRDWPPPQATDAGITPSSQSYDSQQKAPTDVAYLAGQWLCSPSCSQGCH